MKGFESRGTQWEVEVLIQKWMWKNIHQGTHDLFYYIFVSSKLLILSICCEPFQAWE